MDGGDAMTSVELPTPTDYTDPPPPNRRTAVVVMAVFTVLAVVAAVFGGGGSVWSVGDGSDTLVMATPPSARSSIGLRGRMTVPHGAI